MTPIVPLFKFSPSYVFGLNGRLLADIRSLTGAFIERWKWSSLCICIQMMRHQIKKLIAPNFAMPCMGLWGTTPGASEFEAETWC